MRASRAFFSILLALAFLIAPVHLNAQTITQVKIGATDVTIPPPGTSVPIAGTYTWNSQTIEIKNYGGTARVYFENDDSSDILRLRDAEIVAVGGAVTDFPFEFSARLKNPPTVPSGGVVWYHTNGTGNFSPYGSAQQGNSIKVEGWIDTDNGGASAWSQIGNTLTFTVSCTTPGCGNYSPAKGFKTASSVSSLATDRDLKGKVWATLKNANDKLRITSGVLLFDGPAPGTGDIGDMAEIDVLSDILQEGLQDVREILHDVQTTSFWLLGAVIGLLLLILVVVGLIYWRPGS